MCKIQITLPIIHPMLGINNCLQIIESGVRSVVLCLSQDGACIESFENFRDNSLKVLTNEKRGGLKVVIFDRSSFKLLSL